jgi:hypothetical protein
MLEFPLYIAWVFNQKIKATVYIVWLQCDEVLTLLALAITIMPSFA